MRSLLAIFTFSSFTLGAAIPYLPESQRPERPTVESVTIKLSDGTSFEYIAKTRKWNTPKGFDSYYVGFIAKVDDLIGWANLVIPSEPEK